MLLTFLFIIECLILSFNPTKSGDAIVALGAKMVKKNYIKNENKEERKTKKVKQKKLGMTDDRRERRGKR